MAYTNWKIKIQDINTVNALSKTLGCDEIVARLLINRGLTDTAKALHFLNPDCNNTYDPYLLSDMDKAVARIAKSISGNEKICIYGDYDVDGITSVSTLYIYLNKFTENIEYYIPDRFTQGYGVNSNALSSLKECGCSLIITVDTGISAFAEALDAKEMGIDMIITDHHECQDKLPDACAVINPKRRDNLYPFSQLAGVGVVYKLISALDIHFKTDFHNESIDLVAIGTIADIMPLLDENRYIVKAGLEKASTSPNIGLKLLIDTCLNTSTVNAGSVGFAIAPRINAAGRMENAQTAVRLFITRHLEEADEIASHLCELNSTRQLIENDIYNEAVNIIETHDLDSRCSVLVLWKEGWHNGVIGIVASRLKDRYNKPVVLFSVDDKAKGSARSVAPFNIFEAFESFSDILLQYGGHQYAAGLLIECSKLHELRDRLCKYYDDSAEIKVQENSIDVECVLPFSSLNMKTITDISVLQPFGKHNFVPLFCVKNVRITGIYPTSNSKHLRLKLNEGNTSITCFYFGVSLKDFDYRDGDYVDIICEISENEFKSIKSTQLIIHDLRLSENQLCSFITRRLFCDSSDNIISTMLPSRNDIGAVYKYLCHSYINGKKRYNIDTLGNIICKDCLIDINYERVYFSLEILLELGIINGTIQDELLTISDISEGKKFSLCDSSILMSVYEKAGVEFGN